MRKFILLFTTALIAVVALTGCQTGTGTSDEQCTAALTDIMNNQMIMGITGVEVKDVVDMPLTGGQGGQTIMLNEEGLIMARYGTSETAATLLTPAVLRETFGQEAQISEDASEIFGDETVRLEFDDGLVTEAAIARYADYLVMGKAVNSEGLSEILKGFDVALQGYITDHPECDYMHPKTR